MTLLSKSKISLSASQKAAADVITSVFRSKGYNDRTVMAAITNAYAESALKPTAIGDGGNSVGLFQLNIHGGGAGMSVAQRQDPKQNTLRIIEELKRVEASRGAIISGASSLAEAVFAFTKYVERPANADLKGAERVAMAAKLFPSEGSVLQVFQPSTYETHEDGSPNTFRQVVLFGALVLSAGLFIPAVLRLLR